MPYLKDGCQREQTNQDDQASSSGKHLCMPVTIPSSKQKEGRPLHRMNSNTHLPINSDVPRAVFGEGQKFRSLFDHPRASFTIILGTRSQCVPIKGETDLVAEWVDNEQE